jgi:N-formylglutamate amidohydrolase
MVDATFVREMGRGPLIATAIHDGHALWPEVASNIALTESVRLREEDPFTARFTSIAPTRLIATHSRFQCDFNRPREHAVYLTPSEAWGLDVWHSRPRGELLARMRNEHDRFFAALREICDAKISEHGRFVLLDIHSYNHRRDGAEQPPADFEGNPEINVGTGSMPHGRWRAQVEAFLQALEEQSFDARENVRFRGGFLSKWVHETYPDSGCALAVEVKKTFMDEWSGVPDERAISRTTQALDRAAGVLLEVGLT